MKLLNPQGNYNVLSEFINNYATATFLNRNAVLMVALKERLAGGSSSGDNECLQVILL